MAQNMTVGQQSNMVRRPVEVIATPAKGPHRAGSTLRVLHVLSVSVPHLNGYTMRSKYIVQTQQAGNIADPVVATSPFYAGNAAAVRDENIDGVMYHRIAHPTDVNTRRNLDDRICVLCYRSRKWLRSYGPKIRQAMRRVLVQPVKRGWRFLGKSFRRAMKLLVFHRLYWRIIRNLKRGADQGHAPATEGRLSIALRRTMKILGAIVASPFIALASVARAVVPICSISGWIRRVSWGLEGIEEICLTRRFRRDLQKVVDEVKPDLIHAHSPYRCGRPAIDVGKQSNIPVLYEVRGMWEDSGVAEGNFTVDSAKYRYWRKNETAVMQQADAVICICEALRHEVISRGVPAERTYVAPNAVDSTAFRPANETAAVPASVCRVKEHLLGTTIGYVGSIRKLEGVEETVRGAAEMLKQGCDVSLLIVGDGPGLDHLKSLAEELGLGERAVFTGRVPHDKVHHYYSLIDVFVVSRPALRVTEMVTPLKPLEAMAMGKALLVSDLPALRELVADGETGLTYTPGDLSDFSRQCMRYVNDLAFRSKIADTARQWVTEHRSWHAVLEPVRDAYTCVRQRANGMP